VDFYDGTTPTNTAYGMYTTHMYTRRAENIIKHVGANQTDPLFMWLSYPAVHSPNQVPEIYEQPYSFILDSKRRSLAGMVAGMSSLISSIV